MTGPVRIGVVGAGALGYHHVRLLREVEGATLVGFHDARTDRAAQVSGELDVRAFESLDALVDACDALRIAAAMNLAEQVAAGEHPLIPPGTGGR